MTTAAAPGRLTLTTAATATRVTVIPITDHGLIALAETTHGGRWCAFPTAVKPRAHTPTDAAAHRLLTHGLRCQHGALRLVAIYDPRPGHPHGEAVYTSTAWWPTGRPGHDHDHRRLVPLATRDDAARHGLRYGQLTSLLTGTDLLAAARSLPQPYVLVPPGVQVSGRTVAAVDDPRGRWA